MRVWKVILGLIILVVLVVAATTAMAAQRGGQNSIKQTNGDSLSKSEASLGIDPQKWTCPTARPEKLPPAALAGATNAALAYFEGVEEAEGQYAASADRYGLDREFFRSNCPELSSQRAELLQKRTVVVDLRWPKMFPSASLSQHTVFVARFGNEYRVWWMWH